MKKLFTILNVLVCIVANAQVCMKPTMYSPGGAIIISGDFNNDGKLDLLNSSDSIRTMIGDGLGNFTKASAIKVANSSNIITSDFNNDGNLDLAVTVFTGGNSYISILLGNGTGGFGFPNPFPSNLYPFGMASNDFNGDGNLDLAVTCNGTNTLSVFMGDGLGNLGVKTDYSFGDHSTYGSVNGVVSKDFNGDGKADLALSATDTLVVFLGNGSGGFASPALYPGGPSTNGSYLCMNDFNGDGNTDIAGADGSSDAVSVWFGTATGTFSAGIKTNFGYPIECGPITTADFNSDGKADLMVSLSYTYKIALLLGTGTGSFNITTSYPDAYVPEGIVAGDYNSDGKPDIAVGNQQGNNFMVFLNVPAPNLNLSSSSPHALCSSASATLTVSGATTYTWSSNTGISNNTVITTVVTPSLNSTYSVVAQTNGCLDSAYFSFTLVTPLVPNICMVTTDSVSNYNYNVIYWDKTPYNNVDSFIVYRKDVFSSSYLQIGAVKKDSLSRFIDTSANIGGPNGGSPQYSSWQYKLAIRDTCGNIGAKSPYHQSMFVQESGSNFSWNAYTVEAGQTNPILGYSFLRDDLNNGNWHILVNTTGISTTDPNYASYPNGNWRVDAVGFNCTPTMRLSGNNNTQSTYLKAHSNVNKPINTTGINQIILNNKQISVYPNPANNIINIQSTKALGSISIYNALGGIVFQTKSKNINEQIDISKFSSGIYTVQTEDKYLKFIKE